MHSIGRARGFTAPVGDWTVDAAQAAGVGRLLRALSAGTCAAENGEQPRAANRIAAPVPPPTPPPARTNLRDANDANVTLSPLPDRRKPSVTPGYGRVKKFT